MDGGEVHVGFDWGGEQWRGRLVQGRLGGMVLSGPVPPPGEVVRFSVDARVCGHRTVFGVGRTARVGAGQGEVYGLKLLRLMHADGLPPLKELVRYVLHGEVGELPPEQVVRIANFWCVVCAPEDPGGPLPRVPRIALETYQAWFRPPDGPLVQNVYLRCTASYLIHTVPYYGRAVRLNETSLVMHTNMPLPPLAHPVLVQLPLSAGEQDGWAVLRGVVLRRSDQRDDAVWKGRFEVKVQDVEEIEHAGLFFRHLDWLRAAGDQVY